MLCKVMLNKLHELSTKKMLPVLETLTKLGAKNLLVRIAEWNVRTLNGMDQIKLLLKEMKQMEINMLSGEETYWVNQIPTVFEHKGYVIVHSPRQGGIKIQGCIYYHGIKNCCQYVAL